MSFLTKVHPHTTTSDQFHEKFDYLCFRYSHCEMDIVSFCWIWISIFPGKVWPESSAKAVMIFVIGMNPSWNLRSGHEDLFKVSGGTTVQNLRWVKRITLFHRSIFFIENYRQSTEKNVTKQKNICLCFPLNSIELYKGIS